MSLVCKYFMRGTCRFGNRCWNSHDLGSTHSVCPYHVVDIETTDDEESFTRRETTQNQTASSASIAPKRRTRRQVPYPAQKSRKNPSESKLMYTLTHNKSREAREGTPDRMLVEIVKKLNESENMVQTLRQQLRSQDNGENFSWIGHQIEQYIDNDLKCNICYGIFIKPTVLTCSHTFCHECIQLWSRRINRCPICRVNIKNMLPSPTLDIYLDKITECLPDDVKSRRESLKIERNNNREDTAVRHGRNQDQDAAVGNIALDDTLFDLISLGDYFDRNRNVRDEWYDSSITSNYQFEDGFCHHCEALDHIASNCPLWGLSPYSME